MKIKIAIGLLAYVCFFCDLLASDVKTQLTPKEIVKTIYKQAIPPSGVDYVPLAHERLAQIEHFLTPKMSLNKTI